MGVLMTIMRLSAMICRGLAALWVVVASGWVNAQPTGYNSPQLAVDALLNAAELGDIGALVALFGPDGKDLVTSGDPVQDRNYLLDFVSKAKEKRAIVVNPKLSNRATLIVGDSEWPFPLPLIKKDGKWFFDVTAGRQEILFRRIGANELDAIQVCRGYVEAQRDYAMLAQQYTGDAQYAQKIFSSPGRRDGLFWRNQDGSVGGPISEAVANAIDEGYSPQAGSGYHGYFFKVLTGQGPNAPMGQMDYVIEGIMIGGFALIAVPAEYGVSGLKTFIVSHDGIVYEKDLGHESLSIAKSINRYNPDNTWHRTDDEWPPEDE